MVLFTGMMNNIVTFSIPTENIVTGNIKKVVKVTPPGEGRKCNQPFHKRPFSM
ncbi:hypothetical protein RND71_032143 [Anisodus tanguticus]|uniref:Uncharacterized protein n=1 Tax=Anisodus tanguticus TaxID=243964 RepID=A0AAE1UY43_9SOLA|nr:hypothetical protein RND71_032143 [Anisodus tanguticus]